jgi:aromatic-L-amino-acid/L-tryptophan decarboxylase
MKLMNAVDATGKAYFIHTKLNEQIVLRMSIGQTKTEENHIKETWDLNQKMAMNC